MKSNVSRLSDLQLASLLEEIASAMQSGIPVSDAMRRLENNRMGRVGRVAGSVAERLEAGQSMELAFEHVGSCLGAPMAASFSAAQKANRPNLLRRFALHLRRRARYARSLRLAWFYPMLLVVVGYALTVLYLAPMVLENLGGEIDWPTWVVSTSQFLVLNWVWPLLAFAIVSSFALVLLQSRNRFPRSIRMQLFCNSLADALAHDLPDNMAIESAAQLSGDPELMAIKNPTLASPEVQRILAVVELPADTFPTTDSKQLTVSVLTLVASMYADRARRRVYICSRWLPRFAMAFLGSSFILGYVWFVIAPVYRQVAQW